MSDKPTVSIENKLGRPIVLSLMDPRDTRRVTLAAGVNGGIDKAFVEAWTGQNPGADFLDHLVITDEPATGT